MYCPVSRVNFFVLTKGNLFSQKMFFFFRPTKKVVYKKIRGRLSGGWVHRERDEFVKMSMIIGAFANLPLPWVFTLVVFLFPRHATLASCHYTSWLSNEPTKRFDEPDKKLSIASFQAKYLCASMAQNRLRAAHCPRDNPCTATSCS